MPYPGASPGAGIDGRYEVVVMGAGPAGEAAAGRAGNPGYSVASVERDTVGGTVVTNGGGPTKTFRELQKGTRRLATWTRPHPRRMIPATRPGRY